MSAPSALPIKQKRCQRCGAEFSCGTGGRAGGCWCMDNPIRLPLPRAGEGDCYCPRCLDQIRQQRIAC
ncbi:MAG: cysteine-rich CWC family protein [Deefgea sp.]